MNTTLIICEPSRIATESFSCVERVFGPSNTTSFQSFDGIFADHESIVIVFQLESELIELHVEKFMKDYAEQLQTKRVALLCFTASTAAAQKYLQEKSLRLGSCLVASDFIEVDISCESDADEIASKLIQLKRKLNDESDMPRNLLMEQIDNILRSHNTCTLCTGCGTRLRATPIEYLYDHSVLYFMSEGGEKFANLSVNPRVSIAIYNAYSGFNHLESIQIEGKFEAIQAFSDQYVNIMSLKGLTVTQLRSLPVQLNIFQVIPDRFEVLNSDFAKSGYHVRQVLSGICTLLPNKS